MKVIGAGLPRTATTTTLIAFEQLGFGPCYHMRDLMADSDGQLPLWEARGRRRARLGGDLRRRRSRRCDFPSSRYYRELLDHYPDAKVC